MDSHFTPFFPTDPRNGYMQKRLDQARRSNERLIVLSYNREEFLQRKIRLCTANGFLLTDEPVPSTAINMVYELHYGNRGWDYTVLYHQHAAEHVLRGCRQGRKATGTKIAQLLSSDPDIQRTISQECQDDNKRQAYWNRARNVLLSQAEVNAFGNMDLRRCPSCLEAVPKRMTKCLSCCGAFLVSTDREPLPGTTSESVADTAKVGSSIDPIFRTNEKV
jgi:hypothetical protein